jgi:hypothetical protein
MYNWSFTTGSSSETRGGTNDTHGPDLKANNILGGGNVVCLDPDRGLWPDRAHGHTAPARSDTHVIGGCTHRHAAPSPRDTQPTDGYTYHPAAHGG